MWEKLFGRRRKAQPTESSDGAMPVPTDLSTIITDHDREKLRLLLALTTEKSQPNINDLNEIVRNIDILALNIKGMGYHLARVLAGTLPIPENTTSRRVGLCCKPATQSDMESDWAMHWLGKLHIPIISHRKYWEYAYVLQALFDGGQIVAGQRGLGFGCGVEPIPSYLAAEGVRITMTDLPPEDSRAAGWSTNNEHAATLEHARASHLIDRDTFERQVELRYLDMNEIPDDLVGYDFCWSICALEHLGSIKKGIEFIHNSLKTLRPGGIAVHTLEFNCNSEGPTIDDWITVLFQQSHIEQIEHELLSNGHAIAPLDFHLGDRPMDQFIDLPPWHDGSKGPLSEWLGQSYHLKVAVDGFAATCFGLIITKAA